MFTGIIEATGVVHRIKPGPKSIRFSLKAGRVLHGLKQGDSLAVNGCCLTAVGIRRSSGGATVDFDLLQETWNRTNLRFTAPGSLVNLERPLAARGRFDGHFVTGHVDDLGVIRTWEPRGADWLLEVSAPRALMRQIVPKGSIAVDGISLTVAAVGRGFFRVWIIPHTHAITALKERRVGDAVNLETDILGKYAERLLTTHSRLRGATS